MTMHNDIIKPFFKIMYVAKVSTLSLKLLMGMVHNNLRMKSNIANGASI